MAYLLLVLVFGIRFVFAAARHNRHISLFKFEKECFVEPRKCFLQNKDILNEVYLKLL